MDEVSEKVTNEVVSFPIVPVVAGVAIGAVAVPIVATASMGAAVVAVAAELPFIGAAVGGTLGYFSGKITGYFK